MPEIILRPYQSECIQSIWDYFYSGKTGNPLIAMPVGSGKSIIPSKFMQEALSQFPQSRQILLTHVKELIEQDYKALKKIWPTAPVGIYSAGLGAKEAYAPLVFGGVGSVRNAIDKIGYRDILWIDEAHLLSPNESSMYQNIIADLRTINPALRVIGLTATPFRMGQGMLTDGGIFTDLVFDITGMRAFNRLIDEYYLSPLIPKRVDNVINTDDVHELAYDFNQRELRETIQAQNITRRALAEAYDLARDRKSWIVFGSGIENCEQICQILNEMGVATTYVHSKLSKDSRDERIKAFKEGRFRAVVNANVLTTGFDHPQIDCIIDLRPTISVVLHVQKYGRGTRPYYHPYYSFEQLRFIENRKAAIEMGQKSNCIILDFAMNTQRLGPINDPRIPKKKGKGTGEVPVKICPECGAYNHTVVRYCCDCGFEFIFRTKIKPEASTAEIIAREQTDIKTFPVTWVNKFIHNKQGKPPTLKVQYFSGHRMFQAWLGFESPNYAKHIAHEWWRQHSEEEIPETVAEAYEKFGTCRKPAKLRVNCGGKYPEILEYLF